MSCWVVACSRMSALTIASTFWFALRLPQYLDEQKHRQTFWYLELPSFVFEDTRITNLTTTFCGVWFRTIRASSPSETSSTHLYRSLQFHLDQLCWYNLSFTFNFYNVVIVNCKLTRARWRCAAISTSKPASSIHVHVQYQPLSLLGSRKCLKYCRTRNSFVF